MNKKTTVLFLSLLFCCTLFAQEKSDLQQRAEAENKEGKYINARALYIKAFEDYFGKGKLQQGVECGVKAAPLYYGDNMYQEAFDLLRRIDQSINASEKDAAKNAALHYLTSKERMQMYMRMKRAESAKEHLNAMERYAEAAHSDNVSNDLLYTKTIYYYTFGQNEKGNACFKEMASKLTASKEYDKVDEAYQTLIASGRRSNNASLVAQSYKSYMAWKDSANVLKHADEIAALKQQIANNETSIAEKDSALNTRMAIIIGLGILAAALAAALIVGAIILLRFILLTRRQKNTIKMVNENNALKAKFISNISAQLSPTLEKLDGRQPEVKALMDFSNHIQKLSELECSAEETLELEETMIPAFCEGIMEQIRDKIKKDVTLTVNAPKMSAPIHKEYVTHILLHLLNNAAEYTPEGGTIWLDFKKRGAHSHQFLVSDTGCGIPEEKREDIFKPFIEVKDLTKGDGLGLPICQQMALKMNGDISIDPAFTKGTRFVLNLHD
jgi:signal transduction histidine kinase